MSNRIVVDSAVLDQLLQRQGINVKRKPPCCGKPAQPVNYKPYLKRLGYTGNIAIKTNGVITEMCSV